MFLKNVTCRLLEVATQRDCLEELFCFAIMWLLTEMTVSSLLVARKGHYNFFFFFFLFLLKLSRDNSNLSRDN